MAGNENRIEEFETYSARFSPEQMAELRAYAKANKTDMISVIRDGVHHIIHQIPGAQFVGEGSLDIMVAGSTHGGPWAEATPEDQKSISITRSMADEFHVLPGDQFLRVKHDSMAEAGIVDGSYVLMHFLREEEDPTRYEIALIQMDDGSSEPKTTIKRWLGWEGPGRPRLEDGAGNRFEVPEGVVAKPIMVARAVMTRL